MHSKQQSCAPNQYQDPHVLSGSNVWRLVYNSRKNTSQYLQSVWGGYAVFA